MGGRGRMLWALVSSYLLASLACLAAIAWPNFGGHVHVPFSSFRANLVFAPLSPWMALAGLAYQPMKALLALVIFIAVFALVFSTWKRSRPS